MLALKKTIPFHAIDILVNSLNIMEISRLVMCNFVPEKHEVNTANCIWLNCVV